MTLSDISSGVVARDQRLFFFLYLGAFLGIFFVNAYDASAVFIVWFLALVALQVGVFYRKLFIGLSVCIIALLIWGGLALRYAEEVRTNQSLFREITAGFTKETPIIGTLQEKTSEKNGGTTYILRNLIIDRQDFPGELGLSVFFSRDFDISLGDRVSFTGSVRLPSNNIDGFDYRKYLLLKDMHGTVQTALYRNLWTDNPGYAIQYVRLVREKILENIQSVYPWETGLLLEWILIWERAGLSDDTKTDFNRAGLTHIIAVSGSNITIILVFLSLFLRPFPRIIQALAIFASVTLFTLIVGFQAPVLRASVFWLVAYVFLLADRRIRIFPVLVAIALLFVLVDPLILNYDVSFHLSFLAVFGLIFVSGFFERMLKFVPKLFVVRESLVLTLSAMVFTLPIMIVDFRQMSIIAPIANVFAVPAIPFVMLFGTLSLLVHTFSVSLGVLTGFGWWIFLQYILTVTHFFWQLSFAAVAIDIGPFKYTLEVFYFMILVFLLIIRGNKNVSSEREETK